MYRDPIGPVTDVTKWRLRSEKGRQIWEYDEMGSSKSDQSFIEKHALGMDTVSLAQEVLNRCQVIGILDPH